MKKGNKAFVRILYIISAVCFLIGIALIVLLRLLEVDSVAQWYNKYTGTLKQFEQTVANLDNIWLAGLFIEVNYIIKAVLPWFPISLLCFATGVVFKWYIAIPLNLFGILILFTIKYYWGKWQGGGNTEKLLAKLEKPYEIMKETDKIGSSLMLFFFRFFPGLPLNSISQIYGANNFDYKKYLLISVGGFTYKLFSYTLIGRNIYDPLSTKFILPMVPLFFLSGFGLLILNGAITVTVTARNRIRLSKRNKKKSGEEDETV